MCKWALYGFLIPYLAYSRKLGSVHISFWGLTWLLGERLILFNII